MEHVKQHIVLWYLNRMNGYVEQSLGKEMAEYELLKDPKMVDKLFGAASQHVDMDTQQTLSGIMPVIQQITQMAEKYRPQPPMSPDTKVLLDTSMAETQRRAERDKAEMSLEAQKAATKAQETMAKMKQDFDIAMEDQQLKLAIATNDQDMKERIETARLTRDAAKLSHEQDKTVLSLIPSGGNYGNE